MKWMGCTGSGKAIAIIDSGINVKRNEFTNTDINMLNDCDDQIGHGTAVTAIIAKIAKGASLYCYSLFENDGNVETQDLINVLEKITALRFFDIIHLSCGVVAHDISKLYEVCKRITDRGTVIISAFDNEGVVSYPAAFDNVIGVDWNRFCSNGSAYYYVENSPINILGTGTLQYLPWAKEGYKYVAGSSFAAPYITGIVAKMLEAGVLPKNILTSLKENAAQILHINNDNYNPQNQEGDTFTIQ